MPSILIVYSSDYGSTKATAEALAAGVATVPGCTALIKTAAEATAADIVAADGLVLGSPVHMGSMDWQMKKFIDTQTAGVWMQGGAIGKVGGAFVTGGGFGSGAGGGELTLLALLADLVELGLLIVPLPSKTPGYAHAGLQWGPLVRTADHGGKPTGPKPEMFEVVRHHGANIARAAVALSGKAIFAQ